MDVICQNIKESRENVTFSPTAAAADIKNTFHHHFSLSGRTQQLPTTTKMVSSSEADILHKNTYTLAYNLSISAYKLEFSLISCIAYHATVFFNMKGR